jgi:hypothetical protein
MQWDSDFKGPVRLRGVLGGLSNIKGWQKRFSRAGLWKVWEDVVGPKISDHAWPERFQEVDTLVIVVSDSIWMQELSFQRTRLLDALNVHLPPDAQLAGMRFELGDVAEVRSYWTSRGTRNRSPERGPGWNGIPADDADGIADAVVRELTDDEMRQALKRLYLRFAGAGKREQE